MITYQEELFGEMVEEMKPHLDQHYAETETYQDKVPLNPDYDAYQIMEDLGVLNVFTARDDGELIGYGITFMNMSPHSKEHLFATNDIIYVQKEYRHTEVAPELISGIENIMQQNDVSILTFHMKAHKPFESLLDSLGFDNIESVYSKYIGK